MLWVGIHPRIRGAIKRDANAFKARVTGFIPVLGELLQTAKFFLLNPGIHPRIRGAMTGDPLDLLAAVDSSPY